MTASDIWDRISLVQGDITTQRVDAIVNAANSTLLGGGGVDGAIHRAAGPQLLEACQKLGGCPTGSAKITPGFDLHAKYVIHAVGPRYRDGRHGESDHLASCYTTAVQLAAANECESIAFPAISCGVYAYPLEEAAGVSLQAVANALTGDSKPQNAIWVLFDESTFAVFQTALVELSNPSPRPGEYYRPSYP